MEGCSAQWNREREVTQQFWNMWLELPQSKYFLVPFYHFFLFYFILFEGEVSQMGVGGVGGKPPMWVLSQFSALLPQCLISTGRGETNSFASLVTGSPGSICNILILITALCIYAQTQGSLTPCVCVWRGFRRKRAGLPISAPKTSHLTHNIKNDRGHISGISCKTYLKEWPSD